MRDALDELDDEEDGNEGEAKDEDEEAAAARRPAADDESGAADDQSGAVDVVGAEPWYSKLEGNPVLPARSTVSPSRWLRRSAKRPNPYETCHR